MASELERLLIKLEVDTLQMRQALRDAESGISNFEGRSGRSMDRAAGAFNRYGQQVSVSLRSAAAAVSAYVGVQQLLASGMQAANLTQTAAAAGLSVEQFQALALAAAGAGQSYQQFADAAATFALKVTEARAKGGDFYEFLKNHLPTVKSQLLATNDMASAYAVVADAVQRLDSDQSRALLTSKAFGEANRDLANVLKQGGQAMQDVTGQASQMAHLIDSDLAKAVKEVKDAFNEIVAIFGGKLMHVTAQAIAQLGAWIPAFRDIVKEVWGLADATNKVAEATNNVTEAQRNGPTPVTVGPAGGPLKLKPKEEPWMSSWQTSIDFTGVDKMRDLERQRLLAVKDYSGAIRMEYERELEEFRRLKADGKIDEEEFQKARVALNQIAGAQIAEYSKGEREKMKSELSEITYAIEDGITAPLRDAFNGNLQPMQNYFRSFLGNLAQAVTQLLVIKPLMESLSNSFSNSVSKGGFLSSIFGSALGGFRASGGPVMAGVPYVVGERGPEVMVPNTSGRIVPNNALRGPSQSAGGAYAGGATVYNIDARGSDISVAERVQMALMAAERGRPKPVADVAAYRKRFPTRGA